MGAPDDSTLGELSFQAFGAFFLDSEKTMQLTFWSLAEGNIGGTAHVARFDQSNGQPAAFFFYELEPRHRRAPLQLGVPAFQDGRLTLVHASWTRNALTAARAFAALAQLRGWYRGAPERDVFVEWLKLVYAFGAPKLQPGAYNIWPHLRLTVAA